jgi:AcrR family transcriptional regulator
MRVKDKDKRAAIQQATLEIVAEQGLSALKMADIARRVGISASTLYVYFDSKEALVRTLFQEILRDMVTHVVKDFDHSRPYKVNLKQIWETYLRYLVDNNLVLIFYESVKSSPYFMAMTSDVKSVEMAGPMQLIRLGKAQLLLKDIDEDLLLAALAGLTEHFSKLFIQKAYPIDARHLDLCFGLLWDAIKA